MATGVRSQNHAELKSPSGSVSRYSQDELHLSQAVFEQQVQSNTDLSEA